MTTSSSTSARYFLILILGALVLGAAFAGFSAYERAVLGEYRLAIGKAPLYTPYYLGRLVAIAVLALLWIGALYRWRDRAAGIDRPALGGGKRAAAYAALVFAAACTVLFAADPQRFYEIGLEDGALEWASALLPLACSAAFLYAFFRVLRAHGEHARRGVALLLTALFALALFVMGMEEVSWLQRVFAIDTPALFASNQQQEMNLHNIHSIAFGTVHRVAVFTGLIVLPFLAETAPRTTLGDSLIDFLPSRLVLAVSAPVAAFDYNTWNFFLSPLMGFLTLAILACCAAAAARRGDREERTLHVVLIAFIMVAQAVYLALGHRLVRMWDISEYRELLMAAGLAVFTWQTVARLRTHYRPARGPYHALPA